MTTAWLILLVAGLLEVGWAIGLKASDGFNFRERFAWSAGTLVMMVTSMYLLSVAAKSLPIGTAYAVWTGIGALGAATLGMLVFREPATPVRIVCLLMLVAGIVGLKLTSTAGAQPPATTRSNAMSTIYLGTYARGTSEGIYRVSFDADGTIGPATLAATVRNASYLAIHPTRPLLYTISEVGDFNGQKTGVVVAYAIEADGGLRELNRQASGGQGPCFVSVGPDGRSVFVANYSGGSVAMLSVNDDGSLKPAGTIVRHEGKSVNPKRQDKPYAHSITPDPTGRFALACDLGTDEIIVYAVDSAAGTMARASVAKVDAGSGPRHLAFSIDGRSVYVVNELGNSIDRFNWTDGTLAWRQTIDTLPSDFADGNTTAEIAVHPSGKFVYASNRGDDSIACFRVAADGALESAGRQKSGGSKPRNFVISPDGHFLLASNQDGNNVVVFAIDAERGTLTPTGQELRLDAACCARFAR